MRTYETIYITLPTLGEDEEKEILEQLSEVVRQGGGPLHIVDRMGRRRLAYPIKKQEDGVYFRLLYDAEPAVPLELDRRMRLSDKILRYLTVRLDHEWADEAKAQAVKDLQARAEAEQRRREEAARKAEEGESEPAADEEGAEHAEAPVATAAASDASALEGEAKSGSSEDAS